jgi:hypothetical protein
MNRKTMLTAAAVSVLGAGLLTATTAFAQNESTVQDPMHSLVQKVADKFNLNQDEVQAVFDEAHKERHAEMEAKFEEQLSQYVSEGKITEEQKQLILQKHEEMKANRETNKETFRNLSDEERRTQMEQKRAELEAWAEENGIDLQYLMPFGKRMHVRGDLGPANMDQQSTASPSVTQ